jgi:ABC-type tungstate transport system substrate-binding protein
LIVRRDATLFEIVSLSLRVSGIALLFSTLTGIPVGAILGLNRSWGGASWWPCFTLV